MDDELLKLCEQLSLITGWFDTRDAFTVYGSLVVMPSNYVRPKFDDDPYIPLYTSDYLLGKLPRRIDKTFFLVITPSEDRYWYAAYSQYAAGNKVKFNIQGDNPLKALLKLTIALHEAGELKAGDA
ncbi:hypothetical protein [Rhodococcus sp. IEGM 1374]|uniref:hypothetical protein n=1 Tax=Rhodococcus sp. IEGM 1374 TaxID=3082221 RepID=UPI002954E464|nr:hypothetical protein [Rhodococcus sp. IEGM 1374]MDV7992097.1 hypothetical protein [Rhodococcus sp. IEGM 1374]